MALEGVGRLSNGPFVMSNAKMAVVMKWEYLVCLAMLLRRFIFAFALRM